MIFHVAELFSSESMKNFVFFWWKLLKVPNLVLLLINSILEL